jgi:ABC-type multidrug transport system ATPase subunit
MVFERELAAPLEAVGAPPRRAPLASRHGHANKRGPTRRHGLIRFADPPWASPMTALRIESLAKRFGRTEAVRDVSLTVERGQIYGLLGPNGSGKTTTLACALGLLRPDRGRLEVLGIPSNRLHRAAGRVAVVFDEPDLVRSLSVAGNLAYTRKLLGRSGSSGRAGPEVLGLVGLDGLDRRRASDLSLGQGRRLSIARALLGSPELLVLDEPLSGLDTVGVRAMLALFGRLRDDGLTLVLSSHRMHEMERIVSHVGIVRDGRMVTEGPLGDLVGDRDDELRVRATPHDRARDVLSGLGLQPVEVSEAEGFRLALDGGVDAARVAAALQEAGCALHVLAPGRRTLLDVFEGVVDGSHVLAGGAAP